MSFLILLLVGSLTAQAEEAELVSSKFDCATIRQKIFPASTREHKDFVAECRNFRKLCESRASAYFYQCAAGQAGEQGVSQRLNVQTGDGMVEGMDAGRAAVNDASTWSKDWLLPRCDELKQTCYQTTLDLRSIRGATLGCNVFKDGGKLDQYRQARAVQDPQGANQHPIETKDKALCEGLALDKTQLKERLDKTIAQGDLMTRTGDTGRAAAGESTPQNGYDGNGGYEAADDEPSLMETTGGSQIRDADLDQDLVVPDADYERLNAGAEVPKVTPQQAGAYNADDIVKFFCTQGGVKCDK